MIILRQGKAKSILENSINSALTAVETYNRPRVQFRVENYIILMIIAWTKLFHAYFQSELGERYFYKEKNGRYKKIDGEKKAWELTECIKEYQKMDKTYPNLSEATVANLRFFIGIRNKIEHRYWDTNSLDILLFGECQALLFNYENLLCTLFGDDYSINTCLAYALQFSHLRAKEQLQAQRDLLSKEMQDIKKYVDKYKTDLPQAIYDSQEYSIKLLQIPKISNTNRHDLAVEFVNWNNLNEEDRANYQRITTIIKDKIVVQRVSNANLLKPTVVIRSFNEKTGIQISLNDHTLLWKAFQIRPLSSSETKFDTISKYCIYDEPHNDYLYTDEWVAFLINLFENHGFTKENLKSRCSTHLLVTDYN